jgi:hypothetical protein
MLVQTSVVYGAELFWSHENDCSFSPSPASYYINLMNNKLSVCTATYGECHSDIQLVNQDQCGTGTYSHSFYVYKGPSPPSCESPNYIDSASGECVAPEEICYTNLELMADECVYIGQDDPNDEVPNGCVLDTNTGKEFCISENEGCTLVNGFEYCPDPAEICGIKNGAFNCLHPEQEGCGYFNGERVCFDPNGNKVDSNSPDHPDNGGNLDGNPNNDVMDNRTPEEGGDPNKQPGYIPPTGEGEGASEKTARDNLNENRKTADNTKRAADSLDEIKDILNQEKLANQDSITGGIDQAADDFIAGTGVDEHIQGIGEGEFDGDMVGGAGDSVTGALPGTGSCTDIIAELWPGRVFKITCSDTARMRDLLSWVFYISTVWYLFNLVTNPPQKGLR